VTGPYVLDNSAWVRLNDPRVEEDRVAEIVEGMSSGLVWTSTVFLLEAGYSARDTSSYLEIRDTLGVLPHAPLDEEASMRALDLRAQLVTVGHHRLPAQDLFTAAVAERHDLTVLHYDGDYDIILERTDCEATAEWLVPRGSL